MIQILALALSLATPAEPTGADIVQKEFQDATFVVQVVKGVQSELVKITKDFGQSYRFKEITAYLKEPLKMRLESKVESTSIVYVINDFVRYWNIPRANLKGSEDLHEKPGKLQTPMDYGILTPSLLEHLFTAKYVRTERATGDYVFDLTYKKPKYSDTSRHRVWVDPKRRLVTKREWFGQDGRQHGTFLYEEPMQRDGVWFPSRGTVKNMDDKVAGVVEYVKVKVNSGLPESLFKA
jgi:outer membrane lipoprotein-sorting protein